MTKAYLAIITFAFFSILFFSTTAPSSLFTFFGKEFSLSFYISLVALPLFYFGYFFLIKRHDLNRIIVSTVLFGVLLFLSSVGTSFFLYNDFCGYLSTNPVITAISEMIKYAYDLALIPYFIFCFSAIKRSFLTRLIYVFIGAWICFGLFQCICFQINSPSLWDFYDSLDVLKVIGGTSEFFEIIRRNYGYFRFYGISSEPASNSTLISVFLIPFLAYKARSHFKFRRYFFLDIVLLLAVLSFGILTVSSSVFVGLAVNAVVFFVLFLRSKTVSKSIKSVVVALLALVFVGILVIPPLRTLVIDKMFLKLFDTSNYSTQYRYSTVWNDIQCLLTSPIFGVGDGNQGYFYASNISGTWMAYSPESQAAMRGDYGIINGGAGLPSYISGFGIYGIVLLLVYSQSLFREMKKRDRWLPKINTIFFGGLILQTILMTVTSGFHRNYLFFLSITFPVACNCDFGSLKEFSEHVLSQGTHQISRCIKI